MQQEDRAISADGQQVMLSLAAALKLDLAAMETHPVATQLRNLVIRMDGFDHDRDDPVREIMSRLGDRWSSLLLLILRTGTFGHATLKRVVTAIAAERAISQRMLTLRLRALERDGLVARSVTPTIPPRVDYSITPLGLELLALLEGMLAWIEANDAAIRQHRAAFAARED
jgi:DNA-binding HxlR family transcriptional regulator